MGTHFLDRLFSPRSIVVFGASENTDAVGGRVFLNLIESGFSGPLYAVNPKYKRLFKQPCYSSVVEVDKSIDLAIIVTPVQTLVKIIHDCAEQGIRDVIIISAGLGGADSHQRKQLLNAARQHQIRILGPNCLGLIRPQSKINATFSKNSADKGHLALVSQSGALCTSILDWAKGREIGFSAIVSMGDAMDIDFGDILDYLAQDRDTHSILLYVEGIHEARRFMSALRIAARMKPVIVIKAGRHSEGSRAAMTHTGAMIGNDDVFEAALQRAGVVRVMTIEQLFSAAQLLASQYKVSGNRLAIITNGGGLGVMAVDRAIDLGVSLADLSRQTISQLNKVLPSHWSQANPVDILGDAIPQRYQETLEICLDDEQVDGVLVMLSPQAMTDSTGCAEAIIEESQNSRKPVLACWMGEQQVQGATNLFAKHHLPYFPNPESSVEAFAYLSHFYQNQQLLMQVPGAFSLKNRKEPDIEGARLIIESVLAEKRKVLTIAESKALLHIFSIPVTQSIQCHTANETLIAAESLEFPVAIKINSPDISHKSDGGGVRLNVSNAHSIRTVYHELLNEVEEQYPQAKIDGVTVEAMYTPTHGRELLIGVIRDPVFGPVITFGAGGTKVELIKDRAVALPPLNAFLAEKVIAQTNISKLLENFRHIPAVNQNAIVQVLLRISEMVCELPEIKELDINPLIADESGVMALDARIVVEHKSRSLDRYAHMAIHPYPNYLVNQHQLADGVNIKIRPIRPEDALIEANFVRNLSPQAKYFRFMQGLNELTQEMLVRFTQLDYNRELALIAVLENEEKETQLGVARYVMQPDGQSCEFAIVVADDWQNKGLGSKLMNGLIQAARQQGIRVMDGEILSNNYNMLELVDSLGFSVHTSSDDPGIKLASKFL